MSEWEIAFPPRDRDARLDLGEVHDLAIEAGLGEEQAGVVTALAIELVGECDTYGDVVDRLAAAGPAERRELLDKARVRAGLLPTRRQEQIDEYERANSRRGGGSLRDAQGRIEARCAEPRCRRFLPDPAIPAVAGEPGVAAKVRCKRWWCDQHRAGHEHDMEPYAGPSLGYSMSGAIRFPDEDAAEAQRAATAAESRRRRHEAQQAERRADGEKIRELERLRDEQWCREHIRLPGGKS